MKLPTLDRLGGNLCCYFTELLSDSAVSARLSDTKATNEVRALDSFYEMLQLDPNRAVYGYVG